MLNGMQLNPEKSEALMVGMRQTLNKHCDKPEIMISEAPIKFSKQIKNLGVIIDRNLTFNEHVNKVVRDCNFHIKGLRHIRPFLDKSTANTIACSIVGSRLDYC